MRRSWTIQGMRAIIRGQIPDISNSAEVTARRRRAHNSRAERPLRVSKVEVGDQRARSAISIKSWRVGSLNPVDRLRGKGYAVPLPGEAVDNGFGCSS